jgi:Cu-Zn family superoxide dismutase
MIMRIVRVTVSTALLAVAALSGAGQATADEQARDSFTVVGTHGTFASYSPGENAVTYRPDLVPAGAVAGVFSLSAPEFGTSTTLTVAGLVPGREYGAHVHTKPCGETGDAAGPHFQKVPDPVSPSVDPAYANPDNEIWLDFTTDRAGHATARSTVDWQFDVRRGKSVVIHETHTHSGPGHAGTAGSRLACVNVNF